MMRISVTATHWNELVHDTERGLAQHADRLFAGFGLLGAVLLARAGNAEPNINWLLTASGAISFVAEIWLLLKGSSAKPQCGPLFVIASLLLLASGLGLFGWSPGSPGETFTGILTTSGAICVFYGVPARLRLPITGPQLGATLYNVSCAPLFWAGIAGDNANEIAAAIAYVLGDVAIMLKRPA